MRFGVARHDDNDDDNDVDDDDFGLRFSACILVTGMETERLEEAVDDAVERALLLFTTKATRLSFVSDQ